MLYKKIMTITIKEIITIKEKNIHRGLKNKTTLDKLNLKEIDSFSVNV